MQKIEKNLWMKVFKYAGFLKFVPFLRMVAVCNNLSFGMVDEKSDIDLFIIAKKGRLFLVRSMVTLIFHILGVRRHRDKIAGRFCLSFFVDDEFLDLSSLAIGNDIYLAYWMKNLVPILDDGVDQEFLKKNQWVENYFEDEEIFEKNRQHLEDEFGEIKLIKSSGFLWSFFKWIFDGKFGDFVEKKLKNWQFNRVQNKKAKLMDNSGILIGEHILKFHNNDRRREYRGLWMEKFGNEKITQEKFKTLVRK